MRLLKEIGRLPQTSALLTADGRLLAPVCEQNRISIPIEHIAESVLHCLVATEDRRFFVHGGIDFKAILRAAYINFENARSCRAVALSRNSWQEWPLLNVQIVHLAVSLRRFMSRC
jgi:membrane carboxypeptidase/penicillin-binding protein